MKRAGPLLISPEDKRCRGSSATRDPVDQDGFPIFSPDEWCVVPLDSQHGWGSAWQFVNLANWNAFPVELCFTGGVDNWFVEQRHTGLTHFSKQNLGSKKIYRPVHPRVGFELPTKMFATRKGRYVFQFPILTGSQCDMLVGEARTLSKVMHLPFDQMGLHIKGHLPGLWSWLETLIAHVSKNLAHPNANLELQSAFFVRYHGSTGNGHPPHHDNSDLTINICLKHETNNGGELHLSSLGFVDTVQQLPGQAIIHSGRVNHYASSIHRGERINLIIWCKANPDLSNWSLLPLDLQMAILQFVDPRTVAAYCCSRRGISVDYVWKCFFLKEHPLHVTEAASLEFLFSYHDMYFAAKELGWIPIFAGKMRQQMPDHRYACKMTSAMQEANERKAMDICSAKGRALLQYADGKSVSSLKQKLKLEDNHPNSMVTVPWLLPVHPEETVNQPPKLTLQSILNQYLPPGVLGGLPPLMLPPGFPPGPAGMLGGPPVMVPGFPPAGLPPGFPGFPPLGMPGGPAPLVLPPGFPPMIPGFPPAGLPPGGIFLPPGLPGMLPIPVAPIPPAPSMTLASVLGAKRPKKTKDTDGTSLLVCPWYWDCPFPGGTFSPTNPTPAPFFGLCMEQLPLRFMVCQTKSQEKLRLLVFQTQRQMYRVVGDVAVEIRENDVGRDDCNPGWVFPKLAKTLKQMIDGFMHSTKAVPFRYPLFPVQ